MKTLLVSNGASFRKIIFPTPKTTKGLGPVSQTIPEVIDSIALGANPYYCIIYKSDIKYKSITRETCLNKPNHTLQSIQCANINNSIAF